MLSCECLSEVLATYGITLELAEALELFLGRSTAAVLQHYAGQGQPLPDGFLADLKSRVRERFEASLQPIRGIASLLDTLAIPHCHDLVDAVTSKSVMMRMAKKSTVRQPSLEPFAVT